MPNEIEPYYYFSNWPQPPQEVDVLADVPIVEPVELLYIIDLDIDDRPAAAAVPVGWVVESDPGGGDDSNV